MVCQICDGFLAKGKVVMCCMLRYKSKFTVFWDVVCVLCPFVFTNTPSYMLNYYISNMLLLQMSLSLLPHIADIIIFLMY